MVRGRLARLPVLRAFTGQQPAEREREIHPISLDEWASYFQWGGLGYGIDLQTTYAGQVQEQISPEFSSMVRLAYKTNGVVFACMEARRLVFSQARFKFRNVRDGRLFGSQELGVLEQPWENGSTSDLLSRAIQDVDLAGNSFWWRQPGPTLVRLRPDQVTIAIGSRLPPDRAALDPNPTLAGYFYTPGGPGTEARFLEPAEVAHFAPTKDPEWRWRGMSWLIPAIAEIRGDKAAAQHKLDFFQHAATSNLAISLDIKDAEAAKRWIEMFREQYEGVGNAYRTMFLGPGANITQVGSTFEQMSFNELQADAEARICAVARVPAVIVGVNAGLQASTYSNFSQARRSFIDFTVRPLLDDFASSIAKLVNVPPGAVLTYDPAGIAAFKEDELDAAQILQAKATVIRTLVDGGFNADAAVRAAAGNDVTQLLGDHSGLVSVQLLPPGSGSEPPSAAVAAAAARFAWDVQPSKLEWALAVTEEAARLRAESENGHRE